MNAESSSRINNQSTLCATCNKRDGTVYQVQLHKRDGTRTIVELSLCDRCSDSHHEFEWIEILDAVE